MKKKTSIMILFMILIVVIGCTACKKQTINSNTSSKNFMGKKRVGNTNANINNGGVVAEDGEWIYFDSSNTGLYKCKKDGSEKEKLKSIKGGAWDINVVDEWVYYRSLGIHRIKKDGTGYEQIAPEDVRGGVHFIDGKIYNGNEYRMNFDGSQKERIYNMNSAMGYTLNIVDEWIYFCDEDIENNPGIFRMKLDGSNLEKIFDEHTDYMIVEGNSIYFDRGKYERSGGLYKMSLDGNDVEEILPIHVSTLHVADGWIYYSYPDKDGLYKIKVDGSENQLLCEDDPRFIQVFEDRIYYNDDSGNLYRIKTDGSNRELLAEFEEEEEDNSIENEVENTEKMQEEKVEEMNLTYTTRWGEANAITFPSFSFNYSKNWTISQNVTSEMEEVVLTNSRGTEIKYSYFAVPDEYSFGGSHATMLRVDITEEAESQFVPGYIQATDYSNMGDFMVGRIHVNGEVDMLTGSEFEEVDGSTSFAVLPKSEVGTVEGITGLFSTEFTFNYGGQMSFVSSSPDGVYTETEEKEIIAILSSFHCVE